MWPIADNETTNPWGPLWTVDRGIDDAFYLLHVEMPGVEARDVDVVVRRGRLLVNVRGELERVLPLPEEVDVSTTEASFADGVLTIHLPRKP